MTAGEPYRAGRPYARALVELGGIRTVLAVPLAQGRCLQLASLRSIARRLRPFSDKQIALLQNFAAQAVIAMENARLLDRAARGAGTADRDRPRCCRSSTPRRQLDAVFDAMLEKAMRLCGAAFGSLYTYDGDVSILRPSVAFLRRTPSSERKSADPCPAAACARA